MLLRSVVGEAIRRCDLKKTTNEVRDTRSSKMAPVAGLWTACDDTRVTSPTCDESLLMLINHDQPAQGNGGNQFEKSGVWVC